MRREFALIIITVITTISCGSKSTAPSVDYGNRDYTPAWSPDGTSIVYLHSESSGSLDIVDYLRIIDAESGELKLQLVIQGNMPMPWNISWTPDGRWILFAAGPGIFKLSATLDTLWQLTSGQFHDSPSWSQMKNLVYFCVNGGSREMGLNSVTILGDSAQRLSTTETVVKSAVTFSDSSDSLAGWVYKNHWPHLCVFDPDSIVGATLLGPNVVEAYMTRISADRRFIAYNAATREHPGDESLYLFDRSTGITSRLAGGTNGVDFSPDGTRLVYPRLSGKVGLWIIDIATRKETRLTFRQN